MDVGLNNRNTLGDINPAFKDVVFFVEANSNETLQLFSDFAKTSMDNIQPLSDDDTAILGMLSPELHNKILHINDKLKAISRPRVDWEQIMSGFAITIGKVGKHPVTVSFSFSKLNGKKVCFYYCTSRVVDYTMVENWLIKHFQLTHDNYTRWNHSDAMNFKPYYLENIDKEPRNTVYKK